MYGHQNSHYNSVLHAIREIEDVYGDRVGWERSVVKSIFKWGQNEAIDDTLRTVWESPAANETYLSDNLIDSLVCSDNNFNGIARYEGHTIDDNNNLTFVGNQSATMNGQTPVAMTTPLARLTRLLLPDNTTLSLTDKVYGYNSSATTVTAGVPNTDSGVYITVRGGQYRQSEKAATAIDSNSYFLVKGIDASLGAGKTGSVEVYFQKRIVGQSFRTFIDPFFINDSNPTPASRDFIRPLIIEPNSDFRVLADRASGNTLLNVTARISGILLRKINQ